MVVNDYAGNLIPRGVLKPIASRLAPTKATAGEPLQGDVVSSRLRIKVQHTHTRQQIRFGQVRMLMAAQRAIHQPMAVLNVESEAADEGLLFVAVIDEVEAILVFCVQHDTVPVGFEGRQTDRCR